MMSIVTSDSERMLDQLLVFLLGRSQCFSPVIVVIVGYCLPEFARQTDSPSCKSEYGQWWADGNSPSSLQSGAQRPN